MQEAHITVRTWEAVQFWGRSEGIFFKACRPLVAPTVFLLSRFSHPFLGWLASELLPGRIQRLFNAEESRSLFNVHLHSGEASVRAAQIDVARICAEDTYS